MGKYYGLGDGDVERTTQQEIRDDAHGPYIHWFSVAG